jgi:hypothetical protein
MRNRIAHSESSYSWIIPPYPEDGLGYCAWIKQAQLGALLFKVKYTALPQVPAVFNPFFLITGKLSDFGNLQPGFSLFIIRLICCIAFLCILWWFLNLFALSNEQRWTSMLLICFSSGFGTIAPLSVKSADLWLVDINTLWSLSWNALFVCSLGLVLLALGLIKKASDSSDTKANGACYVIAGLVTGALAFIHPYDVVLLLGAICIYVILSKRNWISSKVWYFALFGFPPAILQFLLSAINPIIHAHEQSIMKSPSLVPLISGLGLPFIFALVGIVKMFRFRNMLQSHRMLLIWLAVSFIGAYLPFWFQRKILFGIHLPVCILGAIGLDWILKIFTKKTNLPYKLAIALILCITTATHFQVFTMLRQSLRSDPLAYFIPEDYQKAYAYLEKNSSPDDLVLAHYATSRIIPGMSGNTVVFGHWAQSVDRKERMHWVRNLFNPMNAGNNSDGESIRQLRLSNISYIFIDPFMVKDWFRDTIPQWLYKCGRIVYRSEYITIIKMKRNGEK